MNPFTRIAIAFFLISILFLQSCNPAPTQQLAPEPVKLKVLVLSFLSFAPFFVAQEEGYFAEQGLEIEIVEIQRSSEAIPALSKGQVDVVGGALSVGALNAIARDAGLKFVADKGHLAESGCAVMGVVAGKELVESGQLATPAQLKGKKISLNPAGFTGYYTEKLLQTAGLTLDDIEVVDLQDSVQFESLGQGAIDVVSTSEPWVTRMVQAGYGVIWAPAQEIVPNAQQALIWFGPSLLEKNPDAGRRFMIAYLKAVRQYNLGKTDRNVDIMAKYTQLEPEFLKAACWPNFRDDGHINAESILEFQDWAAKKGLLDDPITVDQFWDSSFVDYAYKTINESGQ